MGGLNLKLPAAPRRRYRKGKLPNPTELEVIRKFLMESSNLWIEGVEFGRPPSGLSMRVTYRDFQDRTAAKTMLAPNIDDFEELTLLMSDWLDKISGVALQLMERKKARLKANADA